MDAYPPSMPQMAGRQYLYYGQLSYVLVHLPNVDQVTHDVLVANPDVIAFPENLSNTVGGNRNTVEAALESVKVPSSWITPQTTYAEILTRMRKLFQFTQRFHAWFAKRVMNAIWDNDTQLDQLPGFLIEDIQDACNSMSIDHSGITANMPIRDAIGILSQRMP